MEPMHHLRQKSTRIASPDFDHFVGEVAGEIWNKMVHQRPFRHLRPVDYADLFGAVQRVLQEYRTSKK